MLRRLPLRQDFQQKFPFLLFPLKQGNSAENKRQISQKYDELYELQFQPHYMMLVMDSPKDYKYVYNNGFSITIDYGHKVETINYKTKERVRIPLEEQIIVPNTHTPIIDRSIFAAVNQKFSNRRRKNHMYNNLV